MHRLYAPLALLLSLSSVAYGNCIYEGESYPEGATIGPYTCVLGQWVVK